MKAFRRTGTSSFVCLALAAIAAPTAVTTSARSPQLVSFIGYASDKADAPAAVYVVRRDEYVQLVVPNVATLDETTLYAPIQRRTQTWLPG